LIILPGLTLFPELITNKKKRKISIQKKEGKKRYQRWRKGPGANDACSYSTPSASKTIRKTG